MTAPTETEHTAADVIQPVSDSVGRDVLEMRAAVLEMAVRNAGHMAGEAIDAIKPGGVDNRDTSAMGWLYYLCMLNRMIERAPAARATDLRWDAQAMNDMRASLHAEPVALTLENGRKVSVYPKGEYALHRLCLIEFTLRWVLEYRLAIELKIGAMDASDMPLELIELLGKAIEFQSHLERCFTWIVTHPGADVPFEENQYELSPPQWTRELTALDRIQMQAAHMEVNLLRINTVAERTKSLAGSGAESMPLAAFLGLISNEMHIQPRTFARSWSMGEAFVQALLKWEAMERASAKAEQEQKV